jgi:hypothetical protein
LGGHGAGGFEFAAFLTEEKFAVGIEDSEGGNAAIEGDIIFFGEVEIFVLLADIDVDDEKSFVEGRSDFWAVEGLVENMTVEAPVGTKDDEDPLVGSCCSMKSFGDFLGSVGIGGVEVFCYEGLTEKSGGATLRDTQKPLVALVEPRLGHGDVLFFESGAVFCGESELEHQNVKLWSGIILFSELGGEIGETVGFPGGPEREFVGEWNLYVVWANGLRGGRLRVESRESGGISGKNGGTPFLEWCEGARGTGLTGWGEDG